LETAGIQLVGLAVSQPLVLSPSQFENPSIQKQIGLQAWQLPSRQEFWHSPVKFKLESQD